MGSRYRAKDQYPGRQAEFVHEITRYEPNRLIGESWGGPMAGHMTTRFADEGNREPSWSSKTRRSPFGPSRGGRSPPYKPSFAAPRELKLAARIGGYSIAPRISDSRAMRMTTPLSASTQ